MKTIVALTLLMASQFALAGTDYKCMSDCSKAGYMYGYCKKACSY